MEMSTVLKLIDLNNEFYAKVFKAFSSTREKPWQGWVKGMEIIKPFLEANLTTEKTLRVSDFAAGNLRFEKYLLEECSDFDLELFAFDSSSSLAKTSALENGEVDFCNLDILKELLQKTLLSSFENEKFGMTCSFGFFHHIPDYQNREQFLKNLVEITADDGFIFLSFWQFANDEKGLAKAELSTHQFFELKMLTSDQVEKQDYFLNWQNDKTVFRYCHNFTDTEIDQLLKSVENETELVARFNADGKDQLSNCYVILQKRGL